MKQKAVAHLEDAPHFVLWMGGVIVNGDAARCACAIRVLCRVNASVSELHSLQEHRQEWAACHI